MSDEEVSSRQGGVITSKARGSVVKGQRSAFEGNPSIEHRVNLKEHVCDVNLGEGVLLQ